MSSKVVPPLLCPIEKHHDGHYLRSSGALYFSLLGSGIRTPGQSIWDRISKFDIKKERSVETAEPSTFFRLFKKRDTDKNKRTPKPEPEYILAEASGKYIQQFRTKRAAKTALLRGDLPLGSYVWDATTMDPWDREYSAEMKEPIATKRCAECDPKNCGCSLWTAIRDGGMKEAWRTPHEVKMARAATKKARQKARFDRLRGEESEDAALVRFINIKLRKK